MGDSPVLTRNHRQEALCRAYVQAVAAQAGLGYSVPVPDYGIDLSLRTIDVRGSRRTDVSYQLDIQLRSTTRAVLTDTHVGFDVDVGTYESLRNPEAGVPRILIVLVLSADEAEWVSQSQQELVIRHCAYWLSLKGFPPTTAARTCRVAIPRSNVFSSDRARAILQRVRERKDL
jgi:hypothetical protein